MCNPVTRVYPGKTEHIIVIIVIIIVIHVMIIVIMVIVIFDSKHWQVPVRQKGMPRMRAGAGSATTAVTILASPTMRLYRLSETGVCGRLKAY